MSIWGSKWGASWGSSLDLLGSSSWGPELGSSWGPVGVQLGSSWVFWVQSGLSKSKIKGILGLFQTFSSSWRLKGFSVLFESLAYLFHFSCMQSSTKAMVEEQIYEVK